MPTYSYKCADCGHAFDIHQSFNDDALTSCPECGGALRKVFGSVGVTFKGSGFYRTDSRSGSQSTPEKKETVAASSASDTKASSTQKSAEKKIAEKTSTQKTAPTKAASASTAG